MRLFLILYFGTIGWKATALDAKGCEYIALLCGDEFGCGDYFKGIYEDCIKSYKRHQKSNDWISQRSLKQDQYDSIEKHLNDITHRIHQLGVNTNNAGLQDKRSYELFDEFTHSKEFDTFLDEYNLKDDRTYMRNKKLDSWDDNNINKKRESGKEIVDNVVTSDIVNSDKASLHGIELTTSGDTKDPTNSQKSSENDNDDPLKNDGDLIITLSEPLNSNSGSTFAGNLQSALWGISASTHQIFHNPRISGNNIHLSMKTSPAWFPYNENAADVAKNINSDSNLQSKINKKANVVVVRASSQGAIADQPHAAPVKLWHNFALLAAVAGGSTLGLICAAIIVCCIKRYKSSKEKLISVPQDEATADYQELCRTQMSLQSTGVAALTDQDDQERQGLGFGKVVKKSWAEEPTAVNMDISTGHVVLAYMEDHLSNSDRLKKEWEALCSYQPDNVTSHAGISSNVIQKNRYQDIIPYDHARVRLKTTTSSSTSDYVNASFVTDIDPRYPAYIATQGPLDNTVADFWQMVWEQGVVVIVNLTQLSDMGLPQCHRYWPEDGSEVYHNFEVHLISEHIWCDDYLVRSFYLKNLQTSETRTVTQFHFLTWQDLSVPESPRPLLEFRRKVNKCYKGQACPIIVHCNNGVGRTGTYILVDMVLNKMIKGAKEIDIAATLEHLRDQRQDMVKTKSQFEFALAAVAEEVTAILNSLPQQ